MATQVTVAGTLKSANATNLAGTVTFTPTQAFYDTAGNLVVPRAPVVATLASGAFSVVLYATDDDTTTPDNATYDVVEDLTDANGNPVRRKFRCEISNGSASQRYEDLVTVEPGPAVASMLTTAALTSHIGDSTAHDASNIDYSGAVTGASTVEEALDLLESGKATPDDITDGLTAAGVLLVAAYTAADAAIDQLDVIEPATRLRIVDEMLGGTASTMPDGWATTLLGTEAVVADQSAANSLPGVKTLATGTDTTGSALSSLDGCQLVGNVTGTAWFRVRIPTEGSTANDFDAYIGLVEGLLAGGAWFVGAPDSNWQAVTHNGTTSTTTDTGVAVDTGGSLGSWVWLKIERTASSVIFSIDGTVVATITTTLPPADPLRPLVGIQKSSGATARQLQVDCVAIDWTLSRGTMG